MGDELWRWTAEAMVRGIGTGAISSREATESCLARLDAVNPHINAVVDLLRDEALESADRADNAVRRGETPGALHGVPVTVKINVDYAGRATTHGVTAFADGAAAADSTSVANLRKAGAVILGRTNVPGFSTRYFTDNELHGRTLNPWDPDRTPGGSSGGAAAAVVAGICPIGHGNDRAGSVRYPAYACGVFGLRPSLGRVPDFDPSATQEPGICVQMANVQGPLARTVGDIRLGLRALAAPDWRDPWSVPAPLDAPAGSRRSRAAILASYPGGDADPAVTEAVRRAGVWLDDAGYDVEEADPPGLDRAADLFWRVRMAEERATASNLVEKYGDETVKRSRASVLAYAGDLDYESYVRALAERTAMLRAWYGFFERYPILVMPISWQRPYPVDHDLKGDEAMREMLDAHRPMIAVSLLGLPGLSAPVSLADGVPVGVQIVAARFGEERLLAAGEVIEARA
ncbi:MAG: amidase, partial [Defluviicoccus sp.]|nr:amidase [Defluviicoccus sp.]